MRWSVALLLLPAASCVPAEEAVAPPPPGVVIVTDGPRYPIRLGWRAEAGQLGEVTASLEKRSVSTTHGSAGTTTVKTTLTRATTRGRERILESADEGSSQRIRFEVETLDADFDGEEAPIRLRNVVVDVARAASSGAEVVTLGGTSPDALTREILTELFSQETSDVPSDDEAFGTDTPQPIGGSWAIRGDVVERGLRSELPIAGGAASGTMRLVGFGDEAGTPFAEMEGNLRIEPVELAGLPDGATVEHGTVVVGMHWRVPTISMPRLEDESTIAIDVTVATEGNAASLSNADGTPSASSAGSLRDPLEIEIHARTVRHRTYRPIDDAAR